MRSISLDTETTGFEVKEGHRLIEIGCVEMIDGVRTGNVFHRYINPEREVSEGARRVHGMSWRDLRDKPKFAEVAQEFLDFIGDDLLVIHNAEFDMRFLNHELSRCGLGPLRNEVCDTFLEARRRWPGRHASLDALCRRFSVDNSGRDLHGALLDADLLAQVYLEMRGGIAPKLDFAADSAGEKPASARPVQEVEGDASRWPRRRTVPTHPEEARLHAEFAAKIASRR